MVRVRRTVRMADPGNGGPESVGYSLVSLVVNPAVLPVKVSRKFQHQLTSRLKHQRSQRLVFVTH